MDRRWSSTAGALVLGLIGCGLVAAILLAAVSAREANHSVDALAGQLHDANAQLRQLRADNDAATSRARRASRERAALEAQNRALQAQVRALVATLRAHGLPVPVLPSAALTGATAGAATDATGGPDSGSGPPVRPRHHAGHHAAQHGSQHGPQGQHKPGGSGGGPSPSSPTPLPPPAPFPPLPPIPLPTSSLCPPICLQDQGGSR